MMQDGKTVEPRQLGARRELFVDDWLIEEMNGVTLRMHPPVFREIALEFNRPWEGDISWAPVVMKVEECYRLWYRAFREGRAAYTAYAESSDGINWARPVLGCFAFDGTKENNIVWRGPGANMTPFLDINPSTPDSERYKAIVRGGGVFALCSPDGIRWKLMQDDPILTEGPFDSPNVAFWDGERGEYVAYIRGRTGGDSYQTGVRWIRRTTSKDFLHWTVLLPIDTGDAPKEHLYTNACTPYFRAPHIYLMFPKRFVPDRKFHQGWQHDGLSEGVFMSSRDGLHWDRRFMEAFIRPGPDPDNWTERNLITAVGIVPTGPAEISLYCVEHYRHPSVRLRRATLRTDGFVSVNAPYRGGEFVTKPFTFTGSELVVNYATSVAGGLGIDILSVDLQQIDGYQAHLYGDEIERVVAWQDGRNLSALAGQPIRLRFTMKDADLYAIRFRETA